MRLTVIGCSGSFAGPSSPASSYLLRAEHGGRTWSVLLDLGNGALGALQRHLDPVTELDAVFLSHLHPDHCADLLGLYVMRRYRPHDPPDGRLAVHGPSDTLTRLELMYHGLEEGGMGAQFDVHTVDGTPVRVGPFTVTPHRVEHPVEAYGYRVEADGAVLAFTGDTDDCPALGPLIGGADLVLTDSAFVDGRDEPRGIHLSGSRAAAAAVRAGGVRRLMLTHIPSWNDREVCREQAAAVWPGEVELAEPGATYQVGAPATDSGVPVDRAAGLAMYREYRSARGVGTREDDVPVECFGDSPQLADELIAFVVDGPKRATAGLVASYAADGEPLPRAGSHWVACDGSGKPRAVLRSTELRVGPLSSVDAQFAWDEGEYDRTLETWLDGHRRYFRRECERIGIEFSDDLEVCFERFEVVWPPEVAGG
jgi:ribonuclease BN (tRNA processing enzyme)/uncharacterized protein YhfF